MIDVSFKDFSLKSFYLFLTDSRYGQLSSSCSIYLGFLITRFEIEMLQYYIEI